ncbi:MAG TPA: hypothetical protein VF746_09525 [Longimicrobium sp.]|jgi:hypothetical protein
MWLVFMGFGVSLVYGLAGTALIHAVEGREEAQQFLRMYIGPFNTLVTLGLGVVTALLIGSSQHMIPNAIEATFTTEELSTTDYFENKRRYSSLSRTIVFASEMIIIGFIVLQVCHFPLYGIAEEVMLIAGCLQCGLASYAGRKIRYAGMMLHSLLDVQVTRNLFKQRELNVVNTYVQNPRRHLFKERKLDAVNTYVQTVSILALIGVYLGVRSYYGAPFLYDSFIGRSAQVFLLLPVIIATPVLLIFNFYPREVLRKIYDKSIDIELASLHEEIKNATLSGFEKKLRLMEFEKMYREELQYSLQLSWSDLPIGITILVMVLEPLITR